MPHAPRRWRWLVVAVLVLGLFLLAYRAPLPFIRPLWNAADWGSSWHVRHRMADLMISQGSLIGKSKDEVVGMFGSGEGWSSSDYLEYCLGAERGWISVDSEILAIEFDGDGRATNAYIRRD